MPVEIEQKFLVADEAWRAMAGPGQRLRQAYLCASEKNSIRIRIANEVQAWLTIKSDFRGIERDEYEYEVPVHDANDMLELRHSGIIEKTRYLIPIDDLVWEVDVFSGDNTGLIMAEVELEHTTQALVVPAWIGAEVTGAPRYQNSALASQPFKTWQLSQ